VQLSLNLPPTPYVCTARDLAELDYFVFGIGPHPDDVAEQEARIEAARAVAARHRREVNALSGRR